MPERLLRAHFVRRFLDNDLMSPDADRHEVLATVSAAVISCGLFVTILLSVKYVFQVFQSPARTAIPALDDRFLLFGCSMGFMALAALAGWNALSLDARDIAILGPLPITRRTIVRAKLGAMAVVAAVSCVVLNAVTSLLLPILMVAKLPISLAGAGALVLAHSLVSLAAGAFGFLFVLAIRELLHAVLRTPRFTRVSVAMQACLTVAVIASLLLLPGLSSNVAQTWLIPPAASAIYVPPLWFVGLHEWLAGGIMMNLPHGDLYSMGAREAELAEWYRLAQPAFPRLALTAILWLAVAAVAAPSAYWWNNRRMDGSPAGSRDGGSRAGRLVRAIVNRVIVRRPTAQAGFWLAFQCVTRSMPHRIAMATAAAVGVAALMVGLPLGSAAEPQRMATRVFVPQLVALFAVVLGFRHAVGVPADLRANWVFRLAWLGDARHYMSGVKRCALLGLLVPTALILVPIHAVFLGLRLATAQALLGTLTAAVLLQAVLLGFERLPFAAPYAPNGTLKTRGPVYLFGGIAALYALAWLERLALESVAGTSTFIAIAIGAYVVLGFVERRRSRDDRAIGDPADDMTARLGLSGES